MPRQPRRHPGHAHGQQTGSNPCRLICLPGPSCAWQQITEAHTLRRPTSVGDRRGGSSRRAPGCRSTRLICPRPRRPRVRRTLATGLHRQLLGVPRQPLQHGQQLPPGMNSASVVVSQAAGCDEWIASTIVAPGVLNGAAGRGDTWGGLVSSPSKGGDDGRGWRPGPGGVGEGRQRHS